MAEIEAGRPFRLKDTEGEIAIDKQILSINTSKEGNESDPCRVFTVRVRTAKFRGLRDITDNREVSKRSGRTSRPACSPRNVCFLDKSRNWKLPRSVGQLMRSEAQSGDEKIYERLANRALI